MILNSDYAYGNQYVISQQFNVPLSIFQCPSRLSIYNIYNLLFVSFQQDHANN